MSCCCCCKKILYLCKVGVCEGAAIDFGVVAKVPGIHKMVFDFLGTSFILEKTFEADEQIKFPTKDLNEKYVYTVKIFDPAGTQIVIKKDLVEYDCFEFETQMNYTIAET